MTDNSIPLSNGVLTRIGYADVPIPAELVGLTETGVKDIGWSDPIWADEGQIRFGASAWFADIAGRRIVLDPVLAADAFLRADPKTEAEQQNAIREKFIDSGYSPDSVDVVLMSHIDGIGATALRSLDGKWSPFFPNARILISDMLLNTFMTAAPSEEQDIEREAWQALIDLGVVETFTDGEEIEPGLTAEVRGGHCPGHSVFHFSLADDSKLATFIGHLAVSPLHLATGPCQGLHEDAEAAYKLLTTIASDGRTLIGPLWPAPGFGNWRNEMLIAG